MTQNSGGEEMNELVALDSVTAYQDAMKVLWQSLMPTNAFNPTFGFEKTWMNNYDSWGEPLEAGEISVNHNGTVYAGRHFRKVGLVIWDPAHGASVVGRPTIA